MTPQTNPTRVNVGNDSGLINPFSRFGFAAGRAGEDIQREQDKA